MTKKLGILIYDNVQPMDFIGPWEVFSLWKKILKAPIEMYLVAEHGPFVACDDDITVKIHCDFEHAPLFDYFIVPGGVGRVDEVHNQALIDFIQKQTAQAQYVLSVCTGAFLLHQAGLLKGKEATTYWRALPELKKFSDIKVVEKRVVKTGNLWMSGGISSGIDLAFEVIADIAGKETAGKVQLLFEYFPRDLEYATEEMIASLPAYGNITKPELAQYIKEYVESKKKP